MNTEYFLLTPVVYLLLVSVPIVISDVRVARVPNKYTLPALYLWLVCATTHAVVSGEWLWSLVMPIVFGLITLAVGLPITIKGWLGMGDVKLIIFMCLSLSWKSAWVWLLLPTLPLVVGLLGALFVVFVLKRHANKTIRLAPYIYVVYLGLVALLFLN